MHCQLDYDKDIFRGTFVLKYGNNWIMMGWSKDKLILVYLLINQDKSVLHEIYIKIGCSGFWVSYGEFYKVSNEFKCSWMRKRLILMSLGPKWWIKWSEVKGKFSKGGGSQISPCTRFDALTQSYSSILLESLGNFLQRRTQNFVIGSVKNKIYTYKKLYNKNTILNQSGSKNSGICFQTCIR